jgi:hypothetical protein
MELTFLKELNETPELFYILKNKNGIIFNVSGDFGKIIDSLIWMYTNFFNKEIKVFLPNNTTVESLEQITLINGVFIFAYSDLILNNLVKWNKRRINTILKNISKKNQVILLSVTNLKCLDIPIIESFEICVKNSYLQNILQNIYLLDFVDPEDSVFDSNMESMAEIIEGLFLQNKKIYISLNSVPHELIVLLKNKNIPYSKNEGNVRIHSCKTTEREILKEIFDVYIYSLPLIENPLDILYYFHDPNGTYYLDSNNLKNIRWCLKSIYNTTFEPKISIKDSIEFDKYTDLGIDSEHVIVSEGYYTFQASETIQNMDLSNLKKVDAESIRNFIKVKMISKFDIEIKTCQISSPSSPRDRSRKLNSLSNKISSFDYRCDATCEIFKNFTIGVVIWNDYFKNRKEIMVTKGSTFVYQTTSGKWKYTIVG